MNDQQNYPYEKDDELDLIKLLDKIVRFFSNNGTFLLTTTLSGIIAGAIIYFSLPKQFTTKLILHSGVVTNSEEIEIIDSWNELLKRGEYSTVAEYFNCDPAILKKVSNISAEEIQKATIPNNPNGFTVEVLVKDTSILEKLQNGIIYGLENNEYIRERTDLHRENFKLLISQIEDEIRKLDSTKKNIETAIHNRTSSPSSYILDISTVNTEIITLNEKLLLNKESLRFVDAIQVLQKFTKFRKPSQPKLSILLSVGMLAGFMLGYAACVYKYLKRKLAANRRKSG